MTRTRGHILPFFIPHQGCPHQCSFCNQQHISGRTQGPAAEEITRAIQSFAAANLGILPELAYYGGSFTALPPEQQLYYLEPARQGLEQGLLSGVRVSTRPDAIDIETLERLQKFGVSTIELGVQSMSDEVLQAARRGHTAADSVQAVKLLQQSGFAVGVQLMPGLPLETTATALYGANQILQLRPDVCRIYPMVVVKDTPLSTAYRQGTCQPLTLEAAVEITMELLLLCRHYHVTVIRMGLQPTPELEQNLLAGPYHPAFGSLVQSLLWRYFLRDALNFFAAQTNGEAVRAIYINLTDLPKAVGQNRQNMPFYLPWFPVNHKKLFRGKELAPGTVLMESGSGQTQFAEIGEFSAKQVAATVKKFGYALL